MATCEKCWSDSYLFSYGTDISQTEKYHELLKERKDNPCTPEEQAGLDAENCPKCKRKTMHQYAKVCVICNFKND